jgi:AraC-like DNA-binding protein
MDPLSRHLILLNPRTYNCGGLDLGAASAIHFPRHDGLKCYAVISGEAWLSVDGVPDLVHLKAGECFLLPRGRPFCLAGSQDSALAAYCEVEALQCGTIATYGEGGQCLIVGAHYAFTTMQADMLLDLLPPIVHLRNSIDNVALCWTLQRMSEELRHPQPGGVVVAHSLARMMLVQALREHMADSAGNDLGGLSALADAQMSRAITSMQDEPALDWTVEKLANRAGMSRAAFALKFKETVRQSPIEYLTRWRMLLAEDRMAGTTDSIAEIARSLGYESASAFTKVFKKLTGHSPRQHRQMLGISANRG